MVEYTQLPNENTRPEIEVGVVWMLVLARIQMQVLVMTEVQAAI